MRGGENLPTSGSALLVSNHAGTLPLDGMILHAVFYDEIARHVDLAAAFDLGAYTRHVDTVFNRLNSIAVKEEPVHA